MSGASCLWSGWCPRQVTHSRAGAIDPGGAMDKDGLTGGGEGSRDLCQFLP